MSAIQLPLLHATLFAAVVGIVVKWLAAAFKPLA